MKCLVVSIKEGTRCILRTHVLCCTSFWLWNSVAFRDASRTVSQVWHEVRFPIQDAMRYSVEEMGL